MPNGRRYYAREPELDGDVIAVDARLQALDVAPDVRLALKQVPLVRGARVVDLPTGPGQDQGLHLRIGMGVGMEALVSSTCLFGQTTSASKACTISSDSHSVPEPLRSTCRTHAINTTA